MLYLITDEHPEVEHEIHWYEIHWYDEHPSVTIDDHNPRTTYHFKSNHFKELLLTVSKALEYKFHTDRYLRIYEAYQLHLIRSS